MVRARVTYNDNHLKALYSLTKTPYIIKKLISDGLWVLTMLTAGILFLQYSAIYHNSLYYLFVGLAFAAAALLIRNIIKLLSDDKGRHKLPSYQYSTELIFGGEGL